MMKGPIFAGTVAGINMAQAAKFAAKRLNSVHEGEDVAATAAARCLEKGLLDPGYFWTTVWNLIKDVHKKRSTAAKYRDYLTDDAEPDPHQALERQEFSDKLWAAVDELPEDKKHAVMAFAVTPQGFGHRRAAAKRLGVNFGTYRSRLSRGLSIIRRGLHMDKHIYYTPFER